MRNTEAFFILKEGIGKSTELGVKMNIAIVDAGGNLVMFERMDDAWLGSIDIAIKKAKTAVMFNMETEAIGALSQPGESLYGIEHSNSGLITFPGGIPIHVDGKLCGAIGVSGDSVENDKLVAEFAVNTFNTKMGNL